MIDTFRKHLSEQIRTEREGMGLTRKEAADKVFAEYKTYSNFERNPPVNINVLFDYLEKMDMCPIETLRVVISNVELEMK